MTTEELRCTNCGTPLSAEDERCPACGALVGESTSFPAPEEFVHESYQNSDPQEVEVDSSPAYSEPPEPLVIETRPDQMGGEPFAASPPVYTTGGQPRGSNVGRTCAISCVVFLVAGLCCLLSVLVVAWFAGDLIIDILREIGIFL